MRVVKTIPELQKAAKDVLDWWDNRPLSHQATGIEIASVWLATEYLVSHPPPTADIAWPFHGPEIKALWTEWVALHASDGKPIQVRKLKRILRRMSSWTHDRAMTAIRHSLACRYRDIFEPITPPHG